MSPSEEVIVSRDAGAGRTPATERGKGEQPGGASKQNPQGERTWGLGKHRRGAYAAEGDTGDEGGRVSKGGDPVPACRLLLKRKHWILVSCA